MTRQLLSLGVEESKIDYFRVEDYDVSHYKGHIHDRCRSNWSLSYAWLADWQKIPGNVAECGVFRGDFARDLNMAFPDRRLYLFDTFEGFNADDISLSEQGGHMPSGYRDTFSHLAETSAEYVLSRMPHHENVIIRKGWFPETTDGVDDKFVFVSLDMDVYRPMLEGLKFFYPKMVRNGVIVAHDIFTHVFNDTVNIVSEYEKIIGHSLIKIPIESPVSLAIIKE
jgi:hypothetical protein